MGEDEMLPGSAPRSLEPVFVVRFFERDSGGVYSADITNCVSKQIAAASAPDFWAVWDMLAAVFRREVLDDA